MPRATGAPDPRAQQRPRRHRRPLGSPAPPRARRKLLGGRGASPASRPTTSYDTGSRRPARRALTFPCAAPRVRAERGAVRAAARAAPAEGGRGRGGRSWRLGGGSARLAGAVGRRGRLRGGAGSGRGAEEFPGVVYASPPRSVHAHRSLIGHKLGRGPARARPHRQRAEPLGQPPPGRAAVRLRARLRVPPPPPPPTPPGAALRKRGALAGAPAAHALLRPRTSARAAGAALSVPSAISACAPGWVRAGACDARRSGGGGGGFFPSQAVRAGRPRCPGRCLRPGCGAGRCGCPERCGARPPAETQLRAAAARGKSAGCYLLGWFFPRDGL